MKAIYWQIGRAICYGLALACLIALLGGCAQFTEEYWRDMYANMTPEEIAEHQSGLTSEEYLALIRADLPIVATVCIDGDCSLVVLD